MKFYPKLILAFLALALYAPSFFFEYVYMDDYLMVQEGGFYSKIENIPASFTRSVWHPTGSDYNYYRPVSTSVYIVGAWLSTLISGEILPWIFHLTNVLLQMGVAVLLFSLLLKFGSSKRAAFFGACALVLHPASAGTLGWIPGQNELLLALAVIGGFVCYARALTNPAWMLGHAFCFLLSILTKENGVGLPILCAMFLLFSDQRKDLKLWILSFAAWAATLALWVYMASLGGGGSPPAATGAITGMWTGLPYVLIYLGQLVAPLGLSTLPTPQDTPLYFWIAGGLGALGIITMIALKVRRQPIVLIGAAWFIGFLLPTFANVLPEMKNTFILRSDRAYLASVGVTIVMLQLRGDWWQKIWANTAAKIALVMLITAMLGLNLHHQFHFSTGMAFYQSGVDGSPRSPFAHTHLGDMFLFAKNIPAAIKEYEEAIKLNNFEPQAHNNLGVAYMRQGNADKAAAEYQIELQFNPKNLLTWSNLGAIYLNKGEHAKAEVAFRKAVEINPAYKDAWSGLYKIYDFQRKIKERDEAGRQIQKADMDMSKGI